MRKSRNNEFEKQLKPIFYLYICDSSRSLLSKNKVDINEIIQKTINKKSEMTCLEFPINWSNESKALPQQKLDRISGMLTTSKNTSKNGPYRILKEHILNVFHFSDFDYLSYPLAIAVITRETEVQKILNDISTRLCEVFRNEIHTEFITIYFVFLNTSNKPQNVIEIQKNVFKNIERFNVFLSDEIAKTDSSAAAMTDSTLPNELVYLLNKISTKIKKSIEELITAIENDEKTFRNKFVSWFKNDDSSVPLGRTKLLGDLYYQRGDYANCLNEYSRVLERNDSFLEICALSLFFQDKYSKSFLKFMQKAQLSHHHSNDKWRYLRVCVWLLEIARIHPIYIVEFDKLISFDLTKPNVEAVVILEQKARAFLRCKIGNKGMRRKFAFNMFLSFYASKASGLTGNASRCLEKSAAVYEGKNWGSIDSFIEKNRRKLTPRDE